MSKTLAVPLDEEELPFVVMNGKGPVDTSVINRKITLIQKKFDQHHKKISIVNITREFFAGLPVIFECTDSELNCYKDASRTIEQYRLKYQGSDIALTIKTYTPVSVVSVDVIQNHTIEQMNRSIEKAKKYFGQDMMLIIRSFCFNLITSATDHRLDCWVEEGEFSFRFSVPSAKFNVELLILD